MCDRDVHPNRIPIESRSHEETKRRLRNVLRDFGSSRFKFSISAGCLLIALTGCGSPNKANVELRKQNQQLQAKIDSLHRQVETSKAEIAGLREKQGTLPTLPADRLEKLVTVASVRLGKLTGGADLDPSKPGEEGLKVYLTPYDENGDKIKCAGSFEIDAFDLDAPDPATRLGHWTFDSAEAGKHWISFLTEYNYALPLPWQARRPSRDQVTIRVMFTDELTGRKFTEQTVGKVQRLASQQPTTTQAATSKEAK